MTNKYTILGGAIVVSLLMICVTILAALKVDTTAILTVVTTVIVPLLSLFGYSELRSIKEKTAGVEKNTNGNMTTLLLQNADTNRVLVQLLSRMSALPEQTESAAALTEQTQELGQLKHQR